MLREYAEKALWHIILGEDFDYYVKKESDAIPGCLSFFSLFYFPSWLWEMTQLSSKNCFE